MTTTVSTFDEWVEWARNLKAIERVTVMGQLADQVLALARIDDRNTYVRGSYTYDIHSMSMVAIFDVFAEPEPSPQGHLNYVAFAVNASVPADVETVRAYLEGGRP